MARTFAIYGKGGIGKSTVASNTAAVYGGEGLKTLLVGCDPKSDSSINIVGRRIQPLLETMKINKKPDPSLFMRSGFNGVNCVEVGGPEPGMGCAGRGLIIGIRYLIETRITDSFDLVIFDVPADIFCGGLAVVVKEGYAKDALITSSDDFMSLYATNNLCRGFKTLKVKVGGLVYNKASDDGRKYIEQLASRIEIPIIGEVPTSEIIKLCDRMNKTVVETYPSSSEATAFRNLAHNILRNEFSKVPRFISSDDLEVLRLGDSKDCYLL